MTYVVELMILSGAANPRFVLTPAEAAELQRLIASLTERTVAGARARLGYQGMVVYALGLAGRWQPWLSVASGQVTVLYGPGQGRSYRSDALEQHLVKAARRAGQGTLLEHSFRK